MLSPNQLQAKLEKSIAIMRQPRVKMGLVMKEFGKVAKTFGRLVEPDITLCRPGCHHCCYCMPVLLSKLEFEFVQRAVKFNFFRGGAWVREYGEKWNEFSKIYGTTHEATLEAWRGMRIPCPMLDEEQRTCLIYENRPIVCRIRWAPAFFLADCFSGSPLFEMFEGPAQASSYEMGDPLVKIRGPRLKSPLRHFVENTLKDIDKWVFNFQGKPAPLVETIESSSTA